MTILVLLMSIMLNNTCELVPNDDGGEIIICKPEKEELDNQHKL